MYRNFQIWPNFGYLCSIFGGGILLLHFKISGCTFLVKTHQKKIVHANIWFIWYSTAWNPAKTPHILTRRKRCHNRHSSRLHRPGCQQVEDNWLLLSLWNHLRLFILHLWRVWKIQGQPGEKQWEKPPKKNRRANSCRLWQPFCFPCLSFFVEP